MSRWRSGTAATACATNRKATEPRTPQWSLLCYPCPSKDRRAAGNRRLRENSATLYGYVRTIIARVCIADARSYPSVPRNERRCTFVDILRIVLAIILPPLGVFLQVGLTKHFWINVLLTILGYIPGIVHAVWVIAKY